MKLFLDRSIMTAILAMDEVMKISSFLADISFWSETNISDQGPQQKPQQAELYDEHRCYTIDATIKYAEDVFGEGQVRGICCVARRGDRWMPCSVDVRELGTGRQRIATYHLYHRHGDARIEIANPSGVAMYASNSIFI